MVCRLLMSVYYKEKPEYLSLSIESMLNQTVKPDEFIIVKDGPLTTELDEVINNFVTAYPKTFNIIVNETNLVVFAAQKMRGRGDALAEMVMEKLKAVDGKCLIKCASVEFMSFIEDVYRSLRRREY